MGRTKDGRNKQVSSQGNWKTSKSIAEAVHLRSGPHGGGHWGVNTPDAPQKKYRRSTLPCDDGQLSVPRRVVTVAPDPEATRVKYPKDSAYLRFRSLAARGSCNTFRNNASNTSKMSLSSSRCSIDKAAEESAALHQHAEETEDEPRSKRGSSRA